MFHVGIELADEEAVGDIGLDLANEDDEDLEGYNGVGTVV